MRSFNFRFVVFAALIALAPLSSFAQDNQALINKIEARAMETGSDSLVIIQNGEVIYHNDFGHPDKLQSVQSVTKSMCSIAIGILMDRGVIHSVEQPMSDWIPAWAADPLKSEITLRMIMTQTSGLPDDPAISDATDRIEFAKNEALVANPGEEFIYSGVGSALLQVVISQASGQSVESFVSENIFQPMGITAWKWSKDPLGHEATGGGLFMLPSDLIKLGQMMLAGGQYGGKTIISQKAHDRMLTKTQSFADYGLLWWLKLPTGESDGSFREYAAAGWGGQLVVVYPEKNLIAVRTRDPATIDDSNESEVGYGDFPVLIGEWQ